MGRALYLFTFELEHWPLIVYWQAGPQPKLDSLPFTLDFQFSFFPVLPLSFLETDRAPLSPLSLLSSPISSTFLSPLCSSLFSLFTSLPLPFSFHLLPGCAESEGGGTWSERPKTVALRCGGRGFETATGQSATVVARWRGHWLPTRTNGDADRGGAQLNRSSSVSFVPAYVQIGDGGRRWLGRRTRRWFQSLLLPVLFPCSIGDLGERRAVLAEASTCGIVKGWYRQGVV